MHGQHFVAGAAFAARTAGLCEDEVYERVGLKGRSGSGGRWTPSTRFEEVGPQRLGVRGGLVGDLPERLCSVLLQDVAGEPVHICTTCD